MASIGAVLVAGAAAGGAGGSSGLSSMSGTMVPSGLPQPGTGKDFS